MAYFKPFALFVALSAASFTFAQDVAPADSTKNWKLNGVANLNFSQVSLTNWQAGGESSMSGIMLFKYLADYQKDKLTWKNSVDIAYGLMKQGDQNWIKSDDRFELFSKVGYKLSDTWSLTAFTTFRSQFTEGYATADEINLISDFMAPGYVIPGLGFDYDPNDWFSFNISPVTSKITFVNNDSLAAVGAFGVDPGENVRVEIGASARVQIQRKLAENIVLQTKADFFSNYQENPTSIDVNWDLALLMKVNDWLTTSITTTLIYDEDIDIPLEEDADGNVTKASPRVQFKEVFAIGLTLKL